MEFENLEMNILYLMCPHAGQDKPDQQTHGAIKKVTVLKTFSDIPAENVEQAINRICHAGWMTLDEKGTELRLTSLGSEKIEPLCHLVRRR